MQLLDITARRPSVPGTGSTSPGPTRIRRSFPASGWCAAKAPIPRAPRTASWCSRSAGRTAASDTGLQGETVYYYALFPFTGSPPQYNDDPHNRISAMATGHYDFAERMYQLLPSVYRRYDARQLPASDSGVAPQDLSRGELRRFLDLPGAQLDQALQPGPRGAGATRREHAWTAPCCRCWPSGSAGAPTTPCR